MLVDVAQIPTIAAAQIAKGMGDYVNVFSVKNFTMIWPAPELEGFKGEQLFNPYPDENEELAPVDNRKLRKGSFRFQVSTETVEERMRYQKEPTLRNLAVQFGKYVCFISK